MYARSRTRPDAQTPCAVLKRCTETTRTETEIMEAGMPTPPWPTNEPMDAIDRLRVDGQPVVRTWRGDHKTRYEFGYPLEDTHLAGETQQVPEDADPATVEEAPGRYHRERGSAGDGALTAGAERKHAPSGTRNRHAPGEACQTTADRRRAEHTS